MPRPRRRRVITTPPAIEGIRPFGMPDSEYNPIKLLFEEYESIKLADYEGLTQEQAAERMNISRPTFTRIYDKARKIIAQAFVEGKAIIIDGGDFQSEDYWYRCEDCNQVTVSKEQSHTCSYCHSKKLHCLNDCHEDAPGENGICICVQCNTEIPHKKGIPCKETPCPECGTKMMRKGCYHHKLYMKGRGL